VLRTDELLCDILQERMKGKPRRDRLHVM